MKKKAKKEQAFSASWKKLAPKSSRRPASRAALRKRLSAVGRFSLLLVVLAVLGYGFWWVDKLGRSNQGPIDLTGPGIPVDQISFRTDGVLTDRWFKNWFGPLRGRTLMDLDIERIHRDLLAEDQISYAQVTRDFPGTLRVELKERQPILVLRLGSKDGQVRDWLVSADGTLYLGTEYPLSMLSLLPSLSVDPSLVRPRKEGTGYEKLAGIPRVAPLLELVRREYPGIYRDWQIVSYERPHEDDPGAHVSVRSGKVKKLRFSPGNYSVQMKRLHYLLLEPDIRRKPVIESIDLSHGRSVFAKI
jgi:hypothetical protein